MRAGGFRVSATLAVVAVTWLAACAQAVYALEAGVHVDPGSPAAKEYALPLNQARETGSTSSPQHSSESTSSPQQSSESTSSSQQSSESTLFGAGIKPPGSNGGGHGAGRGGAPSRPSPHATASSPGSGGGSRSSPPITQTVLRAAREPSSPSSQGSTLALIGGAVAILVLGVFGGTVLRHSRRPTSSA
jgi:cobalamin biosynthesis Mg chelatase CobN